MHTKADYQELLRNILRPLKPYYSRGVALLELGKTAAHYPERVAGLEGFARVLWGLAPFWCGGGVGDIALDDIYRNGLVSGTDPEHPEYWDSAGEVNQRYVEMAAISLGLLLTPEKLWMPLTEREKQNLSLWLGKINTINLAVYPDCNWWFFVVITNLALKTLGQPYRQDLVEHAFNRIETFYLGGGWYQDGTGGRRDYYVSFAIHFYSLIYAVFADGFDAERCRSFRERAEQFAPDFLYWFDDKGRAVPYGRSLTYRFAQGAFWSAYVFAGLKAVPLDVVKGVLSRHLSEWMTQPIFDRDGVLTIGYAYPNLNMAETYNAPGSPYWTLKAFLVLALPDEHPFWRTEEAPMPTLNAVKQIAPSGMLVQRGGGHTTLYPSAVFRNDSFGHMPEKYGKFAYSTGFGFSVATGYDNIELAAPDNMLAFVYDGYVFCRRNAESSSIENGCMRSVWSPVAGITVETLITPTGNGHTRRHTVTNELAACTAFDCGYAVPAPAPNAYITETHGGEAIVRHGGSVCKVVSQSGEATIIVPAPNTNLLYPKTAIPSVRYDIPLGTTILETQICAEVS